MKVLNNERVISKVLIAIISLLILIMPYYRGLFFEESMYPFELILGNLFLIIMIIYRKSKAVEVFQSLLVYPLLFLVLVYFLSSLQRLTAQSAIDEFLRMLIYAFVFIGLLILLEAKKDQWILHTVFVSIIWIALFGLFAQFGWVDFKDAILGARISSVLQYPNTLATMIGAAIIGIMMYALRHDVKWYVRGLYLTQLVPFLIVFVYTQSRAAYIILPFVWVCALIFLKIREQIKFALMTLLLLGFSLPLLINYDQYLSEGNSLMVYMVLGVGVLYACIVTGGQWLFERINGKSKLEHKTNAFYVRMLIPVALLVIILVGFVLIQTTSIITVLPEAIQKRITSISFDAKNMTSRIQFFKDSYQLFQEHWIIGGGGNAWKGLYHSYQSLPYTSTQTHSFPMKILTDVGLLGSIFFVSFIGLLLYTVIRWIRKYGVNHDGLLRIGIPFTMALMIFLHSIVDFNMSYGYVAIVWFTLLALVYVEVREKDTEILLKPNLNWISKLTVWVLVIPALVTLFVIGKYAYAASINIAGTPIKEAVEKASTKVDLSPANMTYRLQKMEALDILVQSTQDEQYKQDLLQEALKVAELDKYNPVSLLKVGQYFAKYGYGMNAYEVSEQALEKAPWQLPVYEQNITFASQLAVVLLRSGDMVEAQKKLYHVKESLDLLEEKMAYLQTLPNPNQYRKFIITAPIMEHGGTALVLLGEYERARTYLEPLLKNKHQSMKTNSYLWTSILEEFAGDTELANKRIKSGRMLDDQFDQKRSEIISMIKQLQH